MANVTGVGPGGKILFPWYERSLTAGDPSSADKAALAEVPPSANKRFGWCIQVSSTDVVWRVEICEASLELS